MAVVLRVLRVGLCRPRGGNPVLLNSILFSRPAVLCATAEERRPLACGIHTSPRSLESLAAHQKQPQITFRNQKGLDCIAPLISTVVETPQAIQTKIKGNIPQWLKGKLLRNGPGKYEFGRDKYAHWFDGMALMHQFEIDGNVVKYRSKFLRSDAYMENSQNNRIMVSEFGTIAIPDPCKTIFERFMSRFEMPKITDNCNVNFVVYKGDYYVSTETNFMHKVDLEKLESKEKVDWTKYIAVNGATAHPHYDPDGTSYNMGNSFGKHGSSYNIICVPPQKTGPSDSSLEGAKVVCAIAPEIRTKPSYYHSFGMSENYVIFTEQPFRINMWKLITANCFGKPFYDAFSWEPQYKTRFHVVNKHTGQVLPWQYHTEPLLTFHQINAFEDQGCIVFDICSISSGNILDVFHLQNLRKAGQALDQLYNTMDLSYPSRFVLPLHVDPSVPVGHNLNPLSYTSARAIRKGHGKIWCTSEPLYHEEIKELAGGFEFPQINYARCHGKKYRFFYGCGFRHIVGDSLIKTDFNTKEIKIWREDGMYPSEPVFVPEPNSSEEDGGIILSIVVTPKQTQGTFLLVLDAKSFTELGRAEVPVQIPCGFHGIFVPQGHK